MTNFMAQTDDSNARVTIVAIMTVRKANLDSFREFERHAAGIMKTHGGRIERTVVVTGETSLELLREIHVVTFPNEPAFSAYRGDPSLRKIEHLRQESVLQTDILVGREGPSYEI